MRADRLARAWSRLRGLEAAERRLLCRAAALLPVIALALRLMGFRRLRSALQRLSPLPEGGAAPDREAGSAALQQAAATAGVVGLAARGLPLPITCLHRSLALWWLLRRRGLDGRLCVGARKDDDGIEAHSWVTLQGVVLDDDAGVGERYPELSGLAG